MQSDRTKMAPSQEVVEVTIPNGAALSAAVNLYGFRLAGIQMPAAWDTAILTLQGSLDGATFYDVYDSDGNAVELDVDDQRFVTVFTGYTAGIPILKLRSGTSASPVNQTADRVIKLLLSKVR